MGDVTRGSKAKAYSNRGKQSMELADQQCAVFEYKP
jgi:hypothetical protein